MGFRIFADTNIFLDYLLERIFEWEYAGEIFALAQQRSLTVITSSSSLVNIIYALKHQRKLERSDVIKTINYILTFTSIAHSYEHTFMAALNSEFSDLEDAIQYFTALDTKGMDYFITSNTKDYKKALPQLPVITPKQFMAMYNKK